MIGLLTRQTWPGVPLEQSTFFSLHLSGEECLTLTQQSYMDTANCSLNPPGFDVQSSDLLVCSLSHYVSMPTFHWDTPNSDPTQVPRLLVWWCPRTELLRLTASPAPSCPHCQSVQARTTVQVYNCTVSSSTYVEIVRPPLAHTWDITSDRLVILREILRRVL